MCTQVTNVMDVLTHKHLLSDWFTLFTEDWFTLILVITENNDLPYVLTTTDTFTSDT